MVSIDRFDLFYHSLKPYQALCGGFGVLIPLPRLGANPVRFVSHIPGEHARVVLYGGNKGANELDISFVFQRTLIGIQMRPSAILWGSLGSLDRATRYATYVGQGFGYLLMFGGLWFMLAGAFLNGLWFIFIGWYLNNAAMQSYQQVVLRRSLSGVKVERVMTTDFPHIDPDISIDSFVHDYLLRYDFAAFPVSKGEDFLGIVTANEVREIPREEWPNTPVSRITKAPDEERVIDENDDAFDALMHMAEGNLRRLLVVHDNKLKGMVTQDSIINLVRTKMQIGI